MPKIRVWLQMQDNGDGSASANPYPTKEAAEAAAENDLEEFGQAFCDNVDSMIINTDDYEIVE